MTEDRWEAFGDYDDDRKFKEGVKHERELVIELWYREMACDCEDAMRHLLTRIKGEI